VIVGSHCTGLDAVAAALSRVGRSTRILAQGSQGGLAALRRGECDIAPIHLMDAASGAYNAPFLSEGLVLVKGWRRMQGIVFRAGDPRFQGRSPAESVAAAIDDRSCIMVNRNQGAGTRVLIDRLLCDRKPPGYWNQPRSHNAVAASVAQGRADWGVAIRPVADALGLGFLPLADEEYDFAMRAGFSDSPMGRAFLKALTDSDDAVRRLGFEPATRG
jgi:molybdate-binding protein